MLVCFVYSSRITLWWPIPSEMCRWLIKTCDGNLSVLFLFGSGCCYEGYNPWHFTRTPEHSQPLTLNSFQGILSTAWKVVTVVQHLDHNTEKTTLEQKTGRKIATYSAEWKETDLQRILQELVLSAKGQSARHASLCFVYSIYFWSLYWV
jgi:hypothetical protein